MSKKHATEAIVAAAQDAPVAEKNTNGFVTAPPPPPYLFGSEVPEGVVLSLEKGKINYIDPGYLSVRTGYNVRDFSAVENVEHVGRMADLIRRHGLETPLKVRVIPPNEALGEGYRVQVIAGETRLRAILYLRGESSHSFEEVPIEGPAAYPAIPVLLAEDRDEVGQTIDFVVSNAGKNLTLLELLTVVNRLRAEGWRGPDIRKGLGFSHTTMGNLVVLDLSTPAMRDTIRQNLLSATWMIDKSGLREVQKKIDEGAPSDEVQTMLNGIEKKVLRLAERRKSADETAAKGRKVTEEGEEAVDQRKEKKAGVIYSRATLNNLISTLQDVLALTVTKEWKEAPDAYRKRAAKIRGFAMTALKDANAQTTGTKAKVEKEAEAPQEEEAGAA